MQENFRYINQPNLMPTFFNIQVFTKFLQVFHMGVDLSLFQKKKVLQKFVGISLA